MSRYLIEPDGDGEPTLWDDAGGYPCAIARRCDTPPELWALAGLLAAPFCPDSLSEEMHQAIRAEKTAPGRR